LLSNEPMLIEDPIEPNDANEPTPPMDPTEPMLAMHSTERVDPIDRIESLDHSDHLLRAVMSCILPRVGPMAKADVSGALLRRKP
jgi:hypothetical protein